MAQSRNPLLQRRLDALADAIELFVMPAALFDSDGIWVATNRAAASVGGYAESEPAGRRFGDLMSASTREAARVHFARCVGAGEPVEFETLVVKASGGEAPVRLRLLPLAAYGSVVGVLAVAYRAKEEELALARSQDAPSLTRRQYEILMLLASAHSTPEIAERLGLATETVRNHVRALLRELNAHSRLEAVVTAERLGLLPPMPYRTT